MSGTVHLASPGVLFQLALAFVLIVKVVCVLETLEFQHNAENDKISPKADIGL